MFGDQRPHCEVSPEDRFMMTMKTGTVLLAQVRAHYVARLPLTFLGIEWEISNFRVDSDAPSLTHVWLAKS